MPDVKRAETQRAIFGAREIDMVINVRALKSGDLRIVERDIGRSWRRAAVRRAQQVIIEAALLPTTRIHRCTLAAVGADYVKTSTGSSSSDGTDVALLRRWSAPRWV